jgi:hypothetical protein
MISRTPMLADWHAATVRHTLIALAWQATLSISVYSERNWTEN